MHEPAEAIREHRGGDLVVLIVLAAFVAFYCIDAIRASRDILNLILVLPLSIAALALCLAQFVISVREGRARTPASSIERERATGQGGPPFAEVLPVIGLFAAYVLTLRWLGFDVGTCLFMAAFLWLHGERRWPWLVGYSIAFGFSLALFFSRMLPYPMPMLLLGTG
jgi:putative tricarboxylic transport membrane protein